MQKSCNNGLLVKFNGDMVIMRIFVFRDSLQKHTQKNNLLTHRLNAREIKVDIV